MISSNSTVAYTRAKAGVIGFVIMCISCILALMMFAVMMFIGRLLFVSYSYWVVTVLTSLVSIGSIKAVSFTVYHLPYKICKLRSTIVGIAAAIILSIIFLFNIFSYSMVNTFQLPNNTFVLINVFLILGVFDGLRLIRKGVSDRKKHSTFML